MAGSKNAQTDADLDEGPKAEYGVTYRLECPCCYKMIAKKDTEKKTCSHCAVGFNTPNYIELI